ncbi:transcriptional regulator, partial [Paenibacillus sp. 28ISP30-2]|nr:transcriptional regulator [Paenibacillus sp. 28ISP30-2]
NKEDFFFSSEDRLPSSQKVIEFRTCPLPTLQQTSELEKDGIIGRHVYNQMPPKVEYYITEYGITANEIIDLMCSWGRANIKIRQQQGEGVMLLENDSK